MRRMSTFTGSATLTMRLDITMKPVIGARILPLAPLKAERLALVLALRSGAS